MSNEVSPTEPRSAFASQPIVAAREASTPRHPSQSSPHEKTSRATNRPGKCARVRLVASLALTLVLSLVPASLAESSPRHHSQHAGDRVEPGADPAASAKPLLRDANPKAPASAKTPAQQLVVTYQDGQLSIDAENEPLTAVLNAVAQKTGSIIDLPPEVGVGRIVVHAGPGPARDILSDLLNGSHLNFVIMSSPLDDSGLQAVLLSPREEKDSSDITDKPAETADTVPEVAIPETTSPPQVSAVLSTPDQPPPAEALGQMMRDKAQQIRAQAQQEEESQSSAQAQGTQPPQTPDPPSQPQQPQQQPQPPQPEQKPQ